MAQFRTSSNNSIFIPYEGMDLQTPLPLLPPTKAPWIENFVIDGTSIAARNGSRIICRLPNPDRDIRALGTYITSLENSIYGYSKLDNAIYLINLGTAVLADTKAFTNTPTFIQFRNYLYLINGSEIGRVYNGSTWANIGFTGPSSASLFINGNSYRSRLYLVENFSSKVWYHPENDRIQGAMNFLDLSSIFIKGGTLLNVYPVSYSDGERTNQYLAFVSSEGEVLFYSGAYPLSPDWSLIHRSQIGIPLNANAYVFYQGDTLLCTDTGLVSLRNLLGYNGDGSYQTISRPIDKYWIALVNLLKNNGSSSVVNCQYLPRTGKIYIFFPNQLLRTNNVFSKTTLAGTQITFVYDTIANAWTVMTGSSSNGYMYASCVYANRLFTSSPGVSSVVELEVEGKYDDQISYSVGANTFTPVNCEILSSAFIRYGNSGSVQKQSGLTAFYYLNSLTTNPLSLYLVRNFGKISSATIPNGLINQSFNNTFFNVGSIDEYVQYALKLISNATSGNPSAIYSMNALTEPGGFR
jgi:hypothetical protein